jgi:D-glycero-alpha-D-manno-heptose-7-phosphate kinase
MEIGRRAGALGGKALGASGGGCVLLLAESGREEELSRSLREYGEQLAFAIDLAGVQTLP